MGGFGDPGWTGEVVSLILGVAVGYIFLRLSREQLRLLYRFVDTELVETKSDPSDPIDIRFEDRSVPRVNKTLLYIWNSGRKTADGADIVASDPLRVALPDDTRVLRARLLRVTREVNGVAVHQEAVNEALISFDFLDPGDGATIEVLHTGGAVQRQLKGTIKGIPGGVEEYSSADFMPRRISLGAVTGMLVSSALALAAAITAPGVPSEEDQRVREIIDGLEQPDRELMIRYLEEWGALPEQELGGEWLLYGLAGVIFLVSTLVLVSAGSRHRPPKALLPEKTRPRKRFRFRRQRHAGEAGELSPHREADSKSVR